jgi:Pyruvate/2-oxoacid:ferredoxin oxidoreductase gamma subunit
VGVKFAGAGGDGAQTAAAVLAHAAIAEGFDATHIPSYGPESRGGTSYADVRLAPREVLSPAVARPHALVAFNAPSLARFAPAVVPGGIVIYDSSAVPEPPVLAGLEAVGVPCAQAALELGEPRARNIVALGALHARTRFFPDATYRAALRRLLAGPRADVNEQAFARGALLAGAAAAG